jgi:hypothetical protein
MRVYLWLVPVTKILMSEVVSRMTLNQEPPVLDFSLTAHQRERRRQTMRNRTAPQPLTSEQIGNHLIATGRNIDQRTVAGT